MHRQRPPEEEAEANIIGPVSGMSSSRQLLGCSCPSCSSRPVASRALLRADRRRPECNSYEAEAGHMNTDPRTHASAENRLCEIKCLADCRAGGGGLRGGQQESSTDMNASTPARSDGPPPRENGAGGHFKLRRIQAKARRVGRALAGTHAHNAVYYIAWRLTPAAMAPSREGQLTHRACTLLRCPWPRCCKPSRAH